MLTTERNADVEVLLAATSTFGPRWARAILTNRSIEELGTGEGPNVVACDDSTPVLVMPRDLTGASVDADDRMLSRTAERWIELRRAESRCSHRVAEILQEASPPFGLIPARGRDRCAGREVFTDLIQCGVQIPSGRLDPAAA